MFHILLLPGCCFLLGVKARRDYLVPGYMSLSCSRQGYEFGVLVVSLYVSSETRRGPSTEHVFHVSVKMEDKLPQRCCHLTSLSPIMHSASTSSHQRRPPTKAPKGERLMHCRVQGPGYGSASAGGSPRFPPGLVPIVAALGDRHAASGPFLKKRYLGRGVLLTREVLPARVRTNRKVEASGSASTAP